MKNIIKKVMNLLVFTALLGWVFVNATYLFRNCGYDRAHVNGIRNEENIDVVCVGGSSTFVYWEPYLAWKEYGMTSYNLATNSAVPPVISGYTRYMLETQEPDLAVIDVRSYVGGAGTVSGDEGPIRNMTDSLPLSGGRFRIVTEILNYYDAFADEDADIASFYFDIAKYHGNYERLGLENNWEHKDNDYVCEFKGFEFIEDPCHSIIQEPKGYRTKEKMELDPVKETSLRELLEYLNENVQNALFVAGPIPITRETEMQYNMIGDIVSSYGYEFLNTNDHYREMGIDFAADFYNAGHVNVYGAQKYTRFVADHIKGNYSVPDHRGDKDYEEWDDHYLSAKKRERKVKRLINQQIADKKRANKAGRGLGKIEDDLMKWCSTASDENYTVLALSKGGIPDIYTPWNISGEDREVIRIYSGNAAVYESDTVLDSPYKGAAGSDSKEYSINCGMKSELIVDGRRYKTEKEGMYVLVFDNNYNQVLDVVRIYGNEDGYEWEHVI